MGPSAVPDDKENPLVAALGHVRNLNLVPETLIRFSMKEFRVSRREAEKLVAGFLRIRSADGDEAERRGR